MPNDYKSKMAKTRREDLRARIDAGKCLKSLERVETMLDTYGGLPDGPSPTQIATLKLKVEIQFKKLAKVLPDLKQVELTGEDGGSVMTAVRVQLVSASSDKNDKDT